MKITKHYKIFFIILLVAILLRVSFMSIDPPVWATGDMGLYADEGYKTLSAKNYVLFGNTHPHPKDSYAGWSRLSPISHSLFVFVFELFGTGYVQARLINLVFSLASIVLIFFVIKKMFNTKTALISMLFLSVNISYLIYNKISLLETPLTFFLIASCYFFILAKKKPYFIVGSVIGFILAFLTKPLAILFLPALCYMVYSIFSDKISRKIIIGSLIGIVLTGALFLLTFPQIIDIIILFIGERNPGSLGAFIKLLYQFWYQDFFRFNSILLFMFLGYVVSFISRLIKKKVNSYEIAIFFWAVGGIALLILQTYRPPRYYVTIIPALSILAALYLTQNFKIPKKIWMKGVLGITGVLTCLHLYYFSRLLSISIIFFGMVCGLLLYLIVFVLPVYRFTDKAKFSILFMYIFFNLTLVFIWFSNPSYDLVESSKDLGEIVGDGVLLGLNWAPALCMDTTIECYHVSGWHNEQEEVFQTFGVDYFLIDNFKQLDVDKVPFAQKETFEASLNYIKTYSVGRWNIDLYKFDRESYYE